MDSIYEFLKWFLNTPTATVGFTCLVIISCAWAAGLSYIIKNKKKDRKEK